MARSGSFTVTHPVVTMAVATQGERIVRIWLNAAGDGDPTNGFERDVAAEITEYLEGTRTDFTVPVALDGSPFQHLVWSALQGIPYGETRSYGDIAREIGRPGASRAVGAANHANPIPVVVPCHRVVGSDGSLGGFGGGVDLKRALLAIEARRLIDLPPERGYLSRVQ